MLIFGEGWIYSRHRFIFPRMPMRLVVTASIEMEAKKLWISFDNIYMYIQNHRKHWLEELCSPLPDTIAYKGYMTRLQRIILFSITTNGVIYPVYIWDKQDDIAKNITVALVRKKAQQRQISVEKDISNKRIKIRHF